MLYFYYLHFSVWMRIPVDTFKWRNNLYHSASIHSISVNVWWSSFNQTDTILVFNLISLFSPGQCEMLSIYLCFNTISLNFVNLLVHLGLVEFFTLLPWTVWCHKYQPLINLKQKCEQFARSSSGLSSFADICLFRFFPLSFHGRFNVISARTLPISSSTGNWPFPTVHLG